jgi:FdrA protein
MMGTPANLALLRYAGLLDAEGVTAAPTDLVMGVIATDERAAHAARDAAEAGLAARPEAAIGALARPRTLRGALRERPDASLSLISVPGLYAGAEARKALAAGLHVMLFSDNVPVEQEIELKRFARAHDLFVMGPDCGTAILGGVPLGFANAVPRGRIGIAAASGTGLQALTCHIAAAGEGISHAIGLGGRDLTDEVGGLMLEPALAALQDDPATAVICVIGKPPGPGTAKKIDEWRRRLTKPVVVHFTGDLAASPATLEDTARAAVALARAAVPAGTPRSLPTGDTPAAPELTPSRGDTPVASEFTLPDQEIASIVDDAVARLDPARRFVRGLHAGGTLAQEATALLRQRLGDVAWGAGGGHRDVPLGAGGAGHRVIDLGDDVYTVGRPHPMIDGTVRREWIAREAADPTVAVLLLDVVLGYGVHPDPAGEVLPALREARSVAVIASVCGTDADPQGLGRQVRALREAGVTVMPSNAQAARLAALIVSRRG